MSELPSLAVVARDTRRELRAGDLHSDPDGAPAGHDRLQDVAMTLLKASISESSNSRIRFRSMSSLQNDAAWRAVTASKKFAAYERQFSS